MHSTGTAGCTVGASQPWAWLGLHAHAAPPEFHPRHPPPGRTLAGSRLMLGALWLQEKGRINAWRMAALGLRPLKGGPLAVVHAAAGDIPAPLMCTPLMAPGQAAPPDYPDYVQVRAPAVRPCHCAARAPPKRHVHARFCASQACCAARMRACRRCLGGGCEQLG